MKVKQGSYIVTLKFQKGFIGNCGRENYCFKQKRDDEYMAPVVDLVGSNNNAHSVLSFDCKSWLLEWRYATGEEATEYERLGKPYDVTTLNKKITPASLPIPSITPSNYYSFNWDYQGPRHTVICKIKDRSPHHLIVDWRNYLWIGKGDSFIKYSNGDAYNILEISNLTELSIEQVQQYLPDNHPDKIKISNTSSEQFYIKYNESITEEKFYQLCGILNERIGPFIEHCGIGLSYRNFISPLSSGGEGYIRTELLELGKKGWSLDNNTQGIKKQKFIEDFIPSTKYDPHTFKPIEKPQYNVGDYVITKGYSDTYDGRILKITEITTSGCKKYAYFEVIDGGEWGKSHNFRLDQIERKATQQEIDVYLKPPNEYPKNYEAWLGYIKSKTFSNLKELETIMDRSLTCDFYGVYQKIPGEWTPEKAKWVWDNILYPKTIDEVSKNIPVNSGVVITSGNTETWISGIDHYTSIGTNIPISTKDTKKTLSHQKPYIIKSPKKTSKFVRLTK